MTMPYYDQQAAWNQADTWARTPTSPEQYRYWPWGGFWLTPMTPANPILGQQMAVLMCPADNRQNVVLPGSSWGGNGNVAFTGYLGVSGISGDSTNYTNGAVNGILFLRSKIKMAQIRDGTSNTLLVGERPPSADLYYGWWFAGAGFDSTGTGDVVLGARETAYAASLGCPASKVGFQPGKLNDQCDQAHFWSLHDGGGHFLMGDGTVRFMSYGANAILPQLSTFAGDEAVDFSAY